MVAVKGGRGAGSRVEVVVVLLAPLSVESGGGREDFGAGGVIGLVQLLPRSVLLLLPTRVVGARSSSSLSRPRSGGPPPAPKSLAREVAAHSSRSARERSVAASALSSARRARRDAASSPAAAVQAWCGGVAWRRGPWGRRRSGAVTGAA